MRHLLSIVCVLALGTTGCGKIIEMLSGKPGGSPPGTTSPLVPPGTTPSPGITPPPGTTATPTPAAGGDPQSQTDQQLNEKLSGYIRDCINKYSRRVMDTRDRYDLWVDMEHGPTGREMNIYGLYQLSADGADCAAAVQRGASMPPKVEAVETAAVGYATALQSLLPLVETTYQYYERENYKDDHFARGKELHPQLVAAFRAFDEANDRLSSQIETLKDQLDAREVERARADPSRQLEAMILSIHIKAKKIADMAERSEVTRDLKLTNIDGAQLTTLSTELETEVDQLETYSNSHERAASGFVSEARDFSKTAKDMMRHVRDNESFDRFEFEHDMGEQGTPKRIIDQYNELVDALNRM